MSVVVYMFLLPGLRLPRLKKWLERKRLPGSGREDSGTTSLQPPESSGSNQWPIRKLCRGWRIGAKRSLLKL